MKNTLILQRWMKEAGRDPLTFIFLVWSFLFLLAMAYFIVTD
jgi:hypothetical protein